MDKQEKRASRLESHEHRDASSRSTTILVFMFINNQEALARRLFCLPSKNLSSSLASLQCRKPQRRRGEGLEAGCEEFCISDARSPSVVFGFFSSYCASSLGIYAFLVYQQDTAKCLALCGQVSAFLSSEKKRRNEYQVGALSQYETENTKQRPRTLKRWDTYGYFEVVPTHSFSTPFTSVLLQSEAWN